MLSKKIIVFATLALALATSACADENSVKKALEAKLEGLKVESVRKTPFKGLYEVQADDKVLYVDDKAEFILLGRLFDARGKELRDLTGERMAELEKKRRIDFASLPKDLAIKIVKGNGKRVMAMFSDPDCPYCKRIEHELEKVNDVTVYLYLYPIPSLHPEAVSRARSVWCADDRAKAWSDLMLKGVQPAAKQCDAPLEKIAQLGQKYRFFGTPTLVFANGRVVPGMIPAAKLEAELEGAK
jgi:thiol:disulfide interchange protein DsbC